MDDRNHMVDGVDAIPLQPFRQNRHQPVNIEGHDILSVRLGDPKTLQNG